MDFLPLTLPLGLVVCHTSSEARLCKCALCFFIIFTADLFLIDWDLLGPSFALSCSGQPTWQPSEDQACPEVLWPASPDRPGLRLPLFFHSGLLFPWAWMAQQKLLDVLQGGSPELQSLCWKLCTLFWVSLMVPAFFLFVCQGE